MDPRPDPATPYCGLIQFVLYLYSFEVYHDTKPCCHSPYFLPYAPCHNHQLVDSSKLSSLCLQSGPSSVINEITEKNFFFQSFTAYLLARTLGKLAPSTLSFLVPFCSYSFSSFVCVCVCYFQMSRIEEGPRPGGPSQESGEGPPPG
jgi:hypothetical protein